MQTRLSGKPTSRDPRTNIAIETIRAPAEKPGMTSCHYETVEISGGFAIMTLLICAVTL